MGLDWPTSLELIQRSVRGREGEGRCAGVFPAPALTISPVEDAKSLDDVIRAYEEQIAAV